MVVFSGSEPKDRKELSEMLRGLNGPFCFYDDLSLKEQCRLDERSYLMALLEKNIKIVMVTLIILAAYLIW